MEQSYCLISSHDLERIDKAVVRMLNLVQNSVPYDSQAIEIGALDPEVTYPSTVGACTVLLADVKTRLDYAEPFDPSLPHTPF
jgi:hypothetical protein